ncbi:MAG: hypothetical protein LBU83_13210 [Bacteroidales bacterium]|jgi:hypothetical protein|nr:hypothetical protein [Bacteroidales bacterium]
MKSVLKKHIVIIFVVGFMTGCAIFNSAISYSQFFDRIEESNDPTYGYTDNNPILIKNGDASSSIGSSYYFLSRLRTEKGNKFQILMQACRENPNYGTGPLIDVYLLKSVNENDTIKLYINPYFGGKVKIPVGLSFEKE